MAVLLADVASKAVAASHAHLVRNRGFMLGIGASGGRALVIANVAVAVAAAVFAVCVMRRLRSMPWAVALGLVLGGAAGNLAGRLMDGYVVDWIRPHHWPVVFNLADAAIACGMALSVVLATSRVPVGGYARPS